MLKTPRSSWLLFLLSSLVWSFTKSPWSYLRTLFTSTHFPILAILGPAFFIFCLYWGLFCSLISCWSHSSENKPRHGPCQLPKDVVPNHIANLHTQPLLSLLPSPSQCTWWIGLQFSHSVLSDSVTPWIAARQASLSITNFPSSLKLKSIGSVMPSNHLMLCHPLLLSPSIFPCIRVFSNESVLCIRWPKYWSFNFSISPFNEY